MKRRKKAKVLSFLLCILLIFTTFTPMPIKASGEDEGNNRNVIVTQEGKTVISAPENMTEELQWQYYSDEYKMWISIHGENGDTCTLTYAKVYNMLDDNGQTKIRCIQTTGDTEITSDPVTVILDTKQQEVEKVTEVSNEKVEVDTIVANTTGDNFAVATALFENTDLSDIQTRDESDSIETEEPTYKTYSIVINYVFTDGTIAASPYSATLSEGSSFHKVVDNPIVPGYLPYVALEEETSDSVELNYEDINQNHIITVTYKPTLVNYTVIHYQQNIDNDNYTEVERETFKGQTESIVPEVDKDYKGFYSLLYEQPEIAADGSTVVEIYYDRSYYLMYFDLDGGYGVEPIYAKYDAQIEVGTPLKTGYSFDGWIPSIPDTVPVNGGTYKASWIAGDTSFTVVFWYENADDSNYSYAGSTTIENSVSGSSINSDTYKDIYFSGRDTAHFTYNSVKSETQTVAGDGSTILNVYYTRNTYTLTFRDGKTVVATINAKYNAYIADKFPINGYEGRAWKDTSNRYYAYALQTLDRMPDKNVTFGLYDKSSNTLKTIHYYVEKIDGDGYELLKDVETYFNYITYEEEYHPIEGFDRQSAKESGFDKDNQKKFTNNEVSLYYRRKSYTLSFFNYNETVTGEGGSVKYQASLNDYYFIPDYPDGLEENAYEFEGWYTSPGCYDGSKLDFNTANMPSDNLVLYAKWVPKIHNVRLFNNYEDAAASTNQIGETISVQHGSKVESVPSIPITGGYTFVGWFYMDGNTEKAFDFENMPVNKDMDVYAKWSSNVLKQYFIYYKTKDTDTGTDTEIAAPTVGSALAGISKTFDAKGGTDLYVGYQEGYFPETKSHTITIDIDDDGNNIYTFWYVKKAAVPYTVKYINKETGEALVTEKVVPDNLKAVVTETFVPVSGYMPDAYQKRLVVSDEANAVNEIIFYYTEDNKHAYYRISHHIQNLDGEGYTEYQYTEAIGNIDTEYTGDVISIAGFTYNKDKSEVIVGGKIIKNDTVATLTADGLEIKLYYDRNNYPYEVRYLEQGSGEKLAEPKRGSDKYGNVFYDEAIDIVGYDCVTSSHQKMTIKIEEGDVAKLNVITFYYKEKVATINYVAIGPVDAKDFGTVGLESETIKVKSGNSVGSTPEPGDNFRFVGWYKDENCTQPVTEENGSVDDNDHFTPIKSGEMYESATYYAKFDYALTNLTIRKSYNGNIEENQRFIFHIKGDENNPSTKEINLTVTIVGNSSIIIKDLPVGTYTVTEKTKWSWRYNPDKSSKTIKLPQDDNTIVFENNRDNDNWLNGNAYINNIFTGIAN